MATLRQLCDAHLLDAINPSAMSHAGAACAKSGAAAAWTSERWDVSSEGTRTPPATGHCYCTHCKVLNTTKTIYVY